MKHLIKTTIYTAVILLAATTLSSCGDSTAQETPPPPPPPDPVEILEDRIESERELRLEAEARTDEEAGSRRRWEFAAITLGILTIAGFIGGIAIGSEAKKNAEIA